MENMALLCKTTDEFYDIPNWNIAKELKTPIFMLQRLYKKMSKLSKIISLLEWCTSHEKRAFPFTPTIDEVYILKNQ
jgi:hypothetical protein